MEKRIVLSRHDAARLRALISHQRMLTDADRETLLDLREEIDRAFIVEDDRLPEDAVALDSRVLVRDLATGKSRVYTLVSPSQADLTDGRVSVLAPLGTALLGYRTGDEVEWNMPGGWRRLRIEAVLHDSRSPDGPPTHPSPDRLAA